jgi:uncharacterized phage protein gp47/JayE
VAVDQAVSSVTASTIVVPSTVDFRSSGIAHLGSMANERIHTYTGLTATALTGVAPAPTFTAGDHVWQTGRGGGRAPVGHHVTIGKGTLLTVDITATVELDAGYSIGPSVDEIDLTVAITDVLRAYIDPLPPGGEVVLRRVEATILGVIGVHDIANTTINAVAANLKPTSAQSPVLGTVTMTEGTVT